MDASFALARNVASARFEDIPADAIRVAKTSVLDTLGIILAASTLGEGCREVADLVKEGGGKTESTIIGFGGRVPAWMAAFANGTMAHSLEYDENHVTARIHCGVTVVPASFAVAERVVKVHGKSFLTALVLGMDLGCRIAIAAPLEPRDWHPTGVYGFFAAAAAAGKILSLTADRLQNALGIAYSQAAGNSQAYLDGALVNRLQAGFAAQGGVLSALLAEKGITGAANSLEGEFGLYKVYHRGKYEPSTLTSDLGKRFEVTNLTFKPYPSGRGTHSSIDSVLEIVRDHDISPQDVEAVNVFKSAAAIRALAEPREIKWRPPNVVDAQFSIPYTVAGAAVRRRVGLRDFTPARSRIPLSWKWPKKGQCTTVARPRAIQHASCHHRGKDKGREHILPAGRGTLRQPRQPFPKEGIMAKFMDCTSYSVKPMTRGHPDNAIDMILNLEQTNDVGDIVRLLA
ncbi:MAG: MmgE/PrpD family protein [Chloroflexi bacterium]|nr:MmgE/PrpD family protein [Chloroflexota bacterium]